MVWWRTTPASPRAATQAWNRSAHTAHTGHRRPPLARRATLHRAHRRCAKSVIAKVLRHEAEVDGVDHTIVVDIGVPDESRIGGGLVPDAEDQVGVGDIDLVVLRENTEGEYADVGGRLYQHTNQEVAVQTAVFTRHGTERIIRYAFEEARRRQKKNKVTSITKSNAQGYSMVFWDEVFQEVEKDYPDIETESLLIDAAAMDFVRRPEDFDVVVASNLFGDILTDISAVIIGSMGLAPSANLNPSRQSPSMFEPVHGSAFELIGKGLVNPLATILAAAMMIEFLGESDAGALIHQAVADNLRENKIRTPDIGGASSTTEVGDDIVRRIG